MWTVMLRCSMESRLRRSCPVRRRTVGRAAAPPARRSGPVPRPAAPSAASCSARALAARASAASSSSRRTRSSCRITSSRRARATASASSRSPASTETPPPARPARSSNNTRPFAHDLPPSGAVFRRLGAAPIPWRHDPGHRRRRLHRLQPPCRPGARGPETVVVDRLGDQGKWRNLAAIRRRASSCPRSSTTSSTAGRRWR